MKPHPRIRKTIKWGGAAVMVLLVVVWIGSGWCHVVWWSGGKLAFQIEGGAASLHSHQSWPGLGSYDPGWRLTLSKSSLMGSCQFDLGGEWWDIQVPFWILGAPLLIAAATAWRLDTLARRRAKLNLCPKCGYDRTGLPGETGAVCPECGRPAAPNKEPDRQGGRPHDHHATPALPGVPAHVLTGASHHPDS